MRKLLILLFLAGCLQVPLAGVAQTISLEVKDAPLENVFSLVQRQSPYRFVYVTEDMAAAKKVTLSVINTSINNLLEKIFKDQPVGYSLLGEVITVSKINKPVTTGTSNVFTVTGKVIDEQAKGLPAVTIALSESKVITATDDKGNFVLTDIDPFSVLIVSSIGYETKQIKIAARTNITIQLMRSVSTLDETIIKGYYNTSKRLNTGAVAKLSGEKISKQPVGNVLGAMEGRMPGVYIQQSNGMPGSAYTIQIRGQNSLRNYFGNNGNLPLYVVDGVPYIAAPLGSQFTSGITDGGNPLSNINPGDIESIEVLKDADATAIYGSRGANGVVLITTRKATTGDLTFNLNTYYGAGRVARKMDLLNTNDYLAMRKEAFLNDAATPDPATDYDLLSWNSTRYTNWQEKLLGGVSHLFNTDATLSGGNANTQFLVTGSYHRETTVFPGDFSDQKRAVHFNVISSSSNKKFTISFSGNYMADRNYLLQSDLTARALTLPPNAPDVMDASGKLNWAPGFDNPYAVLPRKYKGDTKNLIGNTVLSYKILDGLVVKTNVGYTQTDFIETNTVPLNSFNPASGATSGYGVFADNHVSSWIIEPQIEYGTGFLKGKLKTLLGASFAEQKQETQAVDAEQFSQDALLENIAAAGSLFVLNADQTVYRYNSLFLRINYDWSGKYLLNATGRRDGSSRFGPGKKFANFGAIGAAWIISKEYFMKALPFVSFAKLRSSYGITGNDQIGDYRYLSNWSPTSYPYQTPGLYPVNLLNPDYSWEKNKKLETALELGFLKDKILFTAAFYRNLSANQLVGYSLPLATGFNSVQANLPATVRNSGWEFEVNAQLVKNSHFSWSASANLTLPRNTLLSYPNLGSSSYANTYVIGKSLYTQNFYHSAGVDPATGVFQFEDVTNKALTPSPIYPDDLRALKSIEQRYYGGVNNTMRYKQLQLDVFLQVVKQDGFNYWYANYTMPGMFGNQPSTVLARWQHPGDQTNVQQFSQSSSSLAYTAYNIGLSDYAITDASFIRLKNVSLSYELPDRIKHSFRMNQCKVYLRAQNLFTITQYAGLDPENQSTSHLPPLRVIIAGIQINL